jgi:hypothetical protein
MARCSSPLEKSVLTQPVNKQQFITRSLEKDKLHKTYGSALCFLKSW